MNFMCLYAFALMCFMSLCLCMLVYVLIFSFLVFDLAKDAISVKDASTSVVEDVTPKPSELDEPIAGPSTSHVSAAVQPQTNSKKGSARVFGSRISDIGRAERMLVEESMQLKAQKAQKEQDREKEIEDGGQTLSDEECSVLVAEMEKELLKESAITEEQMTNYVPRSVRRLKRKKDFPSV